MSCWVLGISALYHDSAAVLLRDGVVVAAAQEERFSRIKHDRALPTRAVKWCLDEAGITTADLEALVYYEKPLKKFERILVTLVATSPFSWRNFVLAMHSWLSDKLWLKNALVSKFAIAPDRILFSEHHLSHAASAFFASPFQEADVLAIDGVGEYATTSLWRGQQDAGTLESIAEIHYPHSIGMLYSTLTAFLGFVVNEGEYKVMGMSPFGEPVYLDKMRQLVEFHDDGGFSLNMKYFAFTHHSTTPYSPKLIELLGEPRFPGSDFTPGEAKSQHYANIASSLQVLTEDLLLHLVKHAHQTLGGKNLCLAGGVALNSVANQRIARESPYENLWIQPAAGDAGGALGAALWAWRSILKGEDRYTLDRCDLGRSWQRDEVRGILNDLGIEFEDLGSIENAVQRAADELAAGGVIGWFQGRFEWGPRALGHRSILADPRTEEMRDRVNARIKFREAFRPFAPAVLVEHADDWFDIPDALRPSMHYMMATVPVLEEKRAEIPATTHVDGSARAQLVDKDKQPVFHQLLSEFHQRTGVPVLLNTSFNLRGEPIVSGPIDAIATLLRSELDALYIEGFRVVRVD